MNAAPAATTPVRSSPKLGFYLRVHKYLFPKAFDIYEYIRARKPDFEGYYDDKPIGLGIRGNRVTVAFGKCKISITPITPVNEKFPDGCELRSATPGWDPFRWKNGGYAIARDFSNLSAHLLSLAGVALVDQIRQVLAATPQQNY